MALNPGDIAIVQYNADGTDDLAFVALVAIAAGEQILFTDNGWLAAGGFRSGEGTITWTAPAGGIAAGTVVTLTTAPAASAGMVSESGDLNFSGSGDQIIAWRDDAGTPVPLFALNNDGASTFQSDATSSNTSALPAGLTLGTDAVAIAEIDNARYTGTTTGTRAELLAAIANPANWSGSNSDNQTGPVSFAVTGAAPQPLVLNELLISTASTDVEFAELFGAPGTSLAGLSLINIEGGDTSGTIDNRHDFAPTDAIGANGFFLLGNSLVAGALGVTPNAVLAANFFENSSSTIALVQTASLTGAAVTGAETVVDAVAVSDGSGTDFYDGAPVLGPDGGGFYPAALGRVADGVDTDTAADWALIDAFSPAGANTTPTAGTAAPSGPMLSVSIAEASMSENGGTASGTVTRSGGTAAPLVVTLASDDTSEATVPASVTIAAGEASAPFTLTAVDDAVADGTQTVTVTASAASFADGTDTIEVTDDEVLLTRIHTIQGTPANQVSGGSPLEGSSVTVQGIVTGVYPGLSGFFVQEEDADADADPLSSEGIFVFLGTAPTVAEGDLVTVTGAVDEFFGMTQIDNDNGNLAVTVNAGGRLGDVTPLAIDRSAFGANDDAAALEQFEGMLVRFQETLTVSEYFELARYGQVILHEGGRPQQFTQTNAPDAAGYQAHLADLASREVILDDGNNIQNAGIGTSPNTALFHPAPGGFGTGTQGVDFFRGGDTVSDLTGILHWSFAGQSGTDAWRVRPVEATAASFTPVNTRADNAAPEDVGGSLTVAGFNVLNYFATIDTTASNNSGTAGPSGTLDARGADSAAELARQTDKLVEALSLIGADIFGLVEIENDTGASAQAIIDALNAEVGAGTYAYIDYIAPGSTSPDFIGTDAIKVAFLYNTQTVAPVGDSVILDSTVDARFADQANRPALAQTFEQIATGESFTAAVNHFKSKGSIFAGDSDQGDGQGNNPNVRTDAAQALVDWLATDPTGSGDPDFLILGDLNAYAMEDAIMAVKAGADDTPGTADDYTDLAQAFIGDGAYSYLFDGQTGTLDYALANQSLLSQVTGTTEWHINADEVPVFDYNDEVRDAGEASFEEKPDTNPLYEVNAFRTSDHDPVIVGLALTSGPAVNLVSGGPGRDALMGSAGDDLFQGGGGTDVITTLAGNDEVDLGGTYGNGMRDHTIIRDFDPQDDILGGIGADDVARSYTIGSRSMLFLDDGDIVTLYGVTDTDTIQFGNDLIV